MGKLDKKVAVVTGGGTGIGRSIALTFAQEGASVVVCGRTLSTLKEVVNEINTLGQRALAVPVDVRVKEQVQNMVEQAIKEFGQIDILVNDAGIGRHGLISRFIRGRLGRRCGHQSQRDFPVHASRGQAYDGAKIRQDY